MSNKIARKKRSIKYQQAEILDIKSLSPTVKMFKLKPDEPFSWIPGQFIITKNTSGSKERIADYTIVSPVFLHISWDIIRNFTIAILILTIGSFAIPTHVTVKDSNQIFSLNHPRSLYYQIFK